MLLDKSEVEITASSSIIGFATEGGGSWEVWNRYLTVDGKKAFHIGNVCDTCAFFFERLEDATRSVNAEAVIGDLNSGITTLGASFVDALALIIPDGKYRVVLQVVHPHLIQPGEKADYFVDEQLALWEDDGGWGPLSPKTEYYRLCTKSMRKGRGLFEFLVPMFPRDRLDRERLMEYEALYNNGAMPTAVSVSVLDVKSPAVWRGEKDITSHWCLAHYLIDGHHKVCAAATSNKPLTLVSFLAVNQGVSSEEEIDELMVALDGSEQRRQRGQQHGRLGGSPDNRLESEATENKVPALLSGREVPRRLRPISLLRRCRVVPSLVRGIMKKTP